MSVSQGLGAITGGLISGGASLIGGAAQNSAAIANQAQAESFDEQMSDTQYTRGVQDMRNAGLNPILAVGSPDSAPVVGAAPVPANLGDAGSAAVQGFNTVNSALNQDASTQSSVNLNSALQAKAAADTAQSLANVANTNADTANKVADLPTHKAAAADMNVTAAGARAIEPVVNSAVDLAHGAWQKLQGFLTSSSQNSSTSGSHSASLSRVGQISQQYHNYPPMTDVPAGSASSLDWSTPPMQ